MGSHTPGLHRRALGAPVLGQLQRLRDEDEWIGSTLAIGADIAVRARKPTIRASWWIYPGVGQVEPEGTSRSSPGRRRRDHGLSGGDAVAAFRPQIHDDVGAVFGQSGDYVGEQRAAPAAGPFRPLASASVRYSCASHSAVQDTMQGTRRACVFSRAALSSPTYWFLR